MYLHIGSDVVIPASKIISIFDMDNTTTAKTTKDFLTSSQKKGRIVETGGELPKSFILCGDKKTFTVYLSQISAKTLFRRVEKNSEEQF